MKSVKALKLDGRETARVRGRMRRTKRSPSGDGDRRRLRGTDESAMLAFHFSMETLRVSGGGRREMAMGVTWSA